MSKSKTPTKAKASKAEEEEKTSWGSGGLLGNRTYGTLGLILGPPIVIMLYVGSCKFYNSSLVECIQTLLSKGILNELKRTFPDPLNPYAWKMILTYSAFELILMRWMPGKIFKANATATGHIPVYIANGVQSYLFTIATMLVLKYYGIWNPADAYDYFGCLLVNSNILAYVLCIFLVFKGLYFPSTKDCGTNNHMLVDFFWGTELYPRIFGFDVKQFTNCRFGMMLWQMLIFCYAFKQYDLYGYVSSSMLVSILIQTLYIFKFFLWETGYFCSMVSSHSLVSLRCEHLSYFN